MSGYTDATQTRVEKMFTNMLRTDREELYRIDRLYQVVTWGLFTSVDHLRRKQRTAEFFRHLADYADKKASEAGA